MHTGLLASLQSELAVHSTHVSLVVSHAGVGALQLALVVQPTHCPFRGSLAAIKHAGAVGDLQSASPAHARQVSAFALVDLSHTGVAPEQVESATHATH